jgi:hypothetical protein
MNSKLAILFAAITAATGQIQTRAASPHDSQAAARQLPSDLPSVEEMIQSRTDVWGDAARRQPDGASYDFFKDLLPPLRWVNTEFRHYPLVLSAPRSAHKTRLVSNGSAVNARANKPPMWHDEGLPVTFFVGESRERFGEFLSQLNGPTYRDGFLPIVTTKYRHEGLTFEEEAFAPVDEKMAASGTALVRFSLAQGGAQGRGRIEARLESQTPLRVDGGQVLNEMGESVVAFSPQWEWEADRSTLVARLRDTQTAELAIFTKPAKAGSAISSTVFDEEKQACIRTWQEFLDRSIQLETPEEIVNQAWRAALIGNLMIAAGDRLHYSAGNAYAKLYEGECGDTLRSIMLYGHDDAAPAMLRPLLEFDRRDTRFHVAGHKLQLLAHFYWLSRDSKTIREYEPLWRQAVQLILNSRETETGLLPKDNYAGDIKTQVYSLNSNANCWRGLRDVAAMLDDMGHRGEAMELRQAATEYRRAILEAVDRSERRDTRPPFIPIALLADEPAHDPLTATRTGSYYDLMCPYVIGSEIFGQGSEREDWLVGYLENHGGIAMGMIRSQPHQGQFSGEPGVNPLYGLRYQLSLLRRDEREKALVGFYGQLAQGMTRGTFIGGEGSRFLHGDANGRSFYLPPNSTSNAAWLVTLRNLLVQDWDLDEDGQPDTLRLMFAVPRRWLGDGKQIRVAGAPTAFGRVSCRVDSKLSLGFVEIQLTPPTRRVQTILLRAPVPAGWQIESVEVDGQDASLVDGDSVDLSRKTEPVTVRFRVKRS